MRRARERLVLGLDLLPELLPVGRDVALDAGRILELERPEGRVEDVAAHVAQRAGAEVPPGAPACPGDRSDGTGASARGRARGPSPSRRGTAGVSAGRPTSMPCGHTGRFVQACTSRTWPMAPAPDPLADQARAVAGVALVAHLRRHLVLARRLGQHARLVTRVRQRLLHVHVLAGLHRRHGDHRVGVVRRRNDDRVDVLLLRRASRGSPCTPWRSGTPDSVFAAYV